MVTRLASLLVLFALPAFAADVPAAGGLPRSAPEAQGIPSESILAFVEGAEKKVDALHSVIVVRRGQVVAEGWWRPYERQDPHVLYSLSKSFASTGIGLAIAEGRLSLDDTVISFFPDQAPAHPGENLKQMRVRDLLSMSTGHHADAIERFPYVDAAKDPVREFLALPVEHKPGTHFVYNTPASFMLSAIVQKVTGTPLVDYLGPRLFEPLGITGARWDATPKGVSLGGFGLSLRTEDIARFGQLLLQKGQWNGRTILPASWVEAATSRQVSNGSNPASDWDQGYGYQFWRCRNGAYRGDGAFGQYCIVMPQQDAVVAITSGLGDMQAVLNLAWEHLQPAMQPGALPADDAARQRLEQKLASLALAPQAGQPASPRAREVSGQLFELPKNEDELEAIGLETSAAGTTLVLRSGGREHRVPCGQGTWKRGGTYPYPLRVSAGPGGGEAVQKVAASGAWTTEDTYTVKACFHETPYCTTMRLWFTGRALVFNQDMNVGFGPTKRPQLVGRPVVAPRVAPKLAKR